jgi:hypothetical protein
VRQQSRAEGKEHVKRISGEIVVLGRRNIAALAATSPLSSQRRRSMRRLAQLAEER